MTKKPNNKPSSTSAIKQTVNAKLDKAFGYLLVIGGAIGLYASFALTMDKIELIKNPNFIPNCNINPIISCGSVIKTDQASAFGFPNPFIGLVAFAVLITIGVSLLSGVKYKAWIMKGLMLGSFLGVVFVHWLAFQSLYRINALCPWCMVVWTVTIASFWYSLLYNLRNGVITINSKYKQLVAFMQKHHLDILLSWYLIIFLLIMNRFWYYWSTLI
jgi:uncharacterized membrane protein